MLDGVAQFASEANWVLDAFQYHTGGVPHSWTGDGIICLLQVPALDRKLSDFVAAHPDVPCVDMSLNDPSLDLPRVLQDNVAIGRMGAEHLISRGCRHLGFVNHVWNSFQEERCKGFCQAAETAGITPSILHPPSIDRIARGQCEWLLQHLPDTDAPLGLMAAADFLTQPIVQVCEAEGLSIPEDIALVGVDNCREICELSSISITSIDNNAFQQGYESARLLDELMKGRSAPAVPLIVPPGALYIRESTDIMATRHPHVATAMRYIADNFTVREMSPTLVAAQVPMSERRLHDAFIRFVGRSIYQEITHQRLQHALQLVQGTERKLWDIAESSGFTSAELMSRLFRRKLGHPPSHYRQSKAKIHD